MVHEYYFALMVLTMIAQVKVQMHVLGCTALNTTQVHNCEGLAPPLASTVAIVFPYRLQRQPHEIPEY